LRYEGTLRQARRSNLDLFDACSYAILAEDYFAAVSDTALQ
jgi:hypothetical protein